MSTEKTVSIFTPANGRKNYIAHDVPVSKLANYSQIVRARYFPGSVSKNSSEEGDKRRCSSMEYNLGESMNEDFARVIAIHIKQSDAADPAPLTLDLFGKGRSLEELVQIWRVIGLGYKCPQEGHDETIRDELRQKMFSTTPFTFADFRLLTTEVWFDRGMFLSTMDRVAFLHIKGYLDDGTKTEIEEYCKSKEGWWDTLLDNVGRVEEKIKGAAAQKEAREKRKEQQKAREERKAREAATGKAFKNGGKGKKGSEKAKPKKTAPPFVRKEDDFPPLG